MVYRNVLKSHKNCGIVGGFVQLVEYKYKGSNDVSYAVVHNSTESVENGWNFAYDYFMNDEISASLYYIDKVLADM